MNLFSFASILLLTNLLTCNCEVITSKESLQQFVEKVSDLKYDCTNSPQEKSVNSEKLVQVVSCDVDGARFDYLYQVTCKISIS